MRKSVLYFLGMILCMVFVFHPVQKVLGAESSTTNEEGAELEQTKNTSPKMVRKLLKQLRKQEKQLRLYYDDNGKLQMIYGKNAHKLFLYNSGKLQEVKKSKMTAGWFMPDGKNMIYIGDYGYPLEKVNIGTGVSYIYNYKLKKWIKGKNTTVSGNIYLYYSEKGAVQMIYDKKRYKLYTCNDGKINEVKKSASGWCVLKSIGMFYIGEKGYPLAKYDASTGLPYTYNFQTKTWVRDNNTQIVKSILVKNPCYTAGKKITVKGLMLHSTGDGESRASAYLGEWNSPTYRRACVHGFIDAVDGKVYQTLPWNHKAWHGGGSSNNGYIGVEMCEPSSITYTGNLTFVCSNRDAAVIQTIRVYNAAVNLFARLCIAYNLNPLQDGVIISHHEGHVRGIASDHGDPEHLWSGLGLPYTMNSFRKAVAIRVNQIKNTK